MEVSSDNMLSMPFGTSSELLFSDVPIVGCVLLATALGAVTEGPAEANAANKHKREDDQEQMHDEPAVSPIGSGYHGVPSERTNLRGRIKVILHVEYFILFKNCFEASSGFIDERTLAARLRLESVLKSISLAMELLTCLGASCSLGWSELCECLKS